MTETHITFIGGGNMSRALLAGLQDHKQFRIRVSDPGVTARAALADIKNIEIFADNVKAAAGAHCVVFAVKPQIMSQVCTSIKSAVIEWQPLLISVAAGIEARHISLWFDQYPRIVRVMPNTPALIGSGASGMFGTDGLSNADRELASEIFNSVGLALWVEKETDIEAVTALSGSGPAYFFYFLEALENTAVNMGLSREVAQRLARQTALGAARMALNEDGDLSTLRERVTSPGGTTAAALAVLSEQQLPTIIDAALQAAAQRAKELATEFGNQ